MKRVASLEAADAASEAYTSGTFSLLSGNGISAFRPGSAPMSPLLQPQRSQVRMPTSEGRPRRKYACCLQGDGPGACVRVACLATPRRGVTSPEARQHLLEFSLIPPSKPNQHWAYRPSPPQGASQSVPVHDLEPFPDGALSEPLLSNHSAHGDANHSVSPRRHVAFPAELARAGAGAGSGWNEGGGGGGGGVGGVKGGGGGGWEPSAEAHGSGVAKSRQPQGAADGGGQTVLRAVLYGIINSVVCAPVSHAYTHICTRNCLTIWPFTRYSFTRKLFCTLVNHPGIASPTCIAHTIAIRLHGFCPTNDSSRLSFRMPYTIQFW